MQDFETSVLVAKTIRSVRVVGNVGLLMLGNPTRPAAQDDLLFYSLSVARAVSQAAEVVGEFVGRANFADTTTPGAEDRGLLRSAPATRMPASVSTAGSCSALTARSRVRFYRRLHLGLQRRHDPLMQVAKAHAYGNDFLFVPTEQVEGLRLDELSRRCVISRPWRRRRHLLHHRARR